MKLKNARERYKETKRNQILIRQEEENALVEFLDCLMPRLIIKWYNTDW